jgi:glyoxylase-like metal-dependent hydrolase (beta-lactamase superfamily II)
MVALALLAVAAPGVRADEAAARARLSELGAVITSNNNLPPAISINLNVSKTNDTDLTVLKEIKNIQTLLLRETPITDSGLAVLRDLSALVTLDLYHTAVSDSGLPHLKHLQGLQTLNLDWTKITDRGLKDLQQLRELRNVNLARTNVGDVGLRALKQLTKLVALDISNTKVTEDGLVELKELKDLRHLNLSFVPVTDAGMKILAQIHLLEELAINSNQVTDAGISELTKLACLKDLSLRRSKLTEAGLTSLLKLPKLESLDVADTAVSDDDVKVFKQFKKLKRLDIRRTRITDKGLSELSKALSETDLPSRRGRLSCAPRPVIEYPLKITRTSIATDPAPTPGDNMCQTKFQGQHQHHFHEHYIRSNPPRFPCVRNVGGPPRTTRREVLARLTAVGLATAASTSPWGPMVRTLAAEDQPTRGPGPAKLFDFKKVADGIYGAIAKPTAMLNCNAAVIVNRDHVLVVDTHSKPSAAKALIRQIGDEITKLPVRYVVDSHLHGDHAMGNEAYPEVFGTSVEVISSVKTREWLEKLGLPRLKESLDGIPQQIASLRAKLESSKDESERAVLKEFIDGLDAYKKEMTPPRVVLPTMTFDRRLVIHRGGREIHLLFLGRAHTAGDVVAFVPSERVIATGDLMHGLLPYMGDGFPDEWPATLKALEALEFDRVIPGHGSIQEGKSVLAQFLAYVEEVSERVQRAIERGEPLAELQKTITPSVLSSLKADDMRRRVERELGTLFPVPEKPAAMFEQSVKSNVREVFTYFTERKGKREIPFS